MKMAEAMSGGMVRGAVAMASNLSGKAISSSFNLARQVRAEITKGAEGLVDWADNSVQSAMRVARGVIRTVDGLAGDLIDGGEQLGLRVVSLGRAAGDSPLEPSSATGEALVDGAIADPKARAVQRAEA